MPHVNTSLVEVLIYLLVAIAVALVARRLKMSPILGYLVVGVIIGPFGTSLISNIASTKILAELGVVFLMFTIGLSLSWNRLQELKKYVFGLGLIQVSVTTVIFTTLIYSLFNADIVPSVVIGAGLALSSTAVVLQVLEERNELTSRHGRISFAVLILQDLAVVVFLVWLSLISGGEKQAIWITLGNAILRAGLVIGVIVLLGRFVLRPIYRMVASLRNPDVFMATTLFIILSTSFSTGYAGLSMELGAFLAGLMISETEYRHQVEADIRPFRNLLLGLFFITVGMSINPALLLSHYSEISSVLFVFLLAKFGIIYLLCKLYKLPFKTSLRIALILAGGGEFVFVLFNQAQSLDYLTQELSNIIYIAVVISMAMTPFLAILGKVLGRKFGKQVGVALRAAEEETVDMRNHVIIVGYGRVGRTVQMLLAEQLIPHVVIDLDMKKVALGRENSSFPIFFGDARRAEVYQALGGDRARAIILTVSDFAVSSRSIMTLRRYFPHLEIFVRVRDSEEAYKLRDVGAHPIMPESFAPSLQLASAVLNFYGIPSEQIDKTLEHYRSNYLSPEAFAKGEVPWISSHSEFFKGEQKLSESENIEELLEEKKDM